MNNVWGKKIPTLIGLILILIGTVVTTILVRGDTIFQIRAGPGMDPKNIKITNVSEVSFTISYLTDDKVISTVNYGIDPNSLDGISLDDRDQVSQQINKYNSHSITVRNLNPNTKYYYSITSGSKKYVDVGFKFEFTTKGEISENPSSQVPISGRVTLPDGTSPNDGIVYVKISDSETISSLLKERGSYTVPLNTLRRLNLDEYIEINEDTIINIDIFAGGLSSSISVKPNEINPVPLITLSGNYDFSKTNEDNTKNNNQESSFPKFGQLNQQGGVNKIISQTPTPSPTPTLSPSPTTVRISPSASPTPSILPQTPTPSVFAQLSPIPTLPPTGNPSVIIASIVGFIATISGIIALFFTRVKNAI